METTSPQPSERDTAGVDNTERRPSALAPREHAPDNMSAEQTPVKQQTYPENPYVREPAASPSPYTHAPTQSPYAANPGVYPSPGMGPYALAPYEQNPHVASPYGPPQYWMPEPERLRAEVPSKRPWPAPGHSILHPSDRPRRRRWWTPLLTALMSGGLYFALIFIVSIIVGIALAVSTTDVNSAIDMFTSARPDLLSPWFYLGTFGSVALMLPFAWLALRVVEGVGIGALSSTEGRLRWQVLGRALGLSLIVFSPTVITSIITMGSTGGVPPRLWSVLPVLLPTVLIIVPIQCAAEEYVFRGLALRTLMGWGLAPVFAILIAAVPFTLGHLYGWLGLLDIAIFALVTGWLAVRTQGLEAGIALHVFNNLYGVLFGILGGGNPLDDADTSVWSIVLSVATMLVYAFVADRMWGPKARLSMTENSKRHEASSDHDTATIA